MNQTLFVGIDVSLKSNQVCALNLNQDKLFNLPFDNTPTGSDKLIESINNLSSLKGSQFLALQRLTHQRKHLATKFLKKNVMFLPIFFLNFQAYKIQITNLFLIHLVNLL